MYQKQTIELALPEMLSKAQSKYIRSLSQQKYRKEYGVFIAEGDKISREWLESDADVQMIAGLGSWIRQHQYLVRRHPEATVHLAEEHELQAISTLQTANQALLVVRKPENKPIDLSNGWSLALDDIQDPGNMGTIIRIADWFGISQIICSPGCADVYNPKVVQAAMGGHLRVSLHTALLREALRTTDLPVIAAALDGNSVYEMPSQNAGIIIIGNESKGISEEIMTLAQHKVTIPRRGGAESLNAGVSAGILCALLVK